MEVDPRASAAVVDLGEDTSATTNATTTAVPAIVAIHLRMRIVSPDSSRVVPSVPPSLGAATAACPSIISYELLAGIFGSMCGVNGGPGVGTGYGATVFSLMAILLQVIRL